MADKEARAETGGQTVIGAIKNDDSNKKKVFSDRKRTNILSSAEEKTIFYLVKRVPGFITSNMLTGIGISGSVIVLIGFILASYVDRNCSAF
jgi:hypothetical protein